MSKIVIALGGNALGLNPSEQRKAIRKFVPVIYNLYKSHDIVIVHGNGPQVGLINGAFETYTKHQQDLEPMPFSECGAMSQGYIGYHIQNEIRNYFLKFSEDIEVITCLTQVEVDPKDPAFKNPTKPIGQFYREDDALKMKEKNNWAMNEDSDRGFRRVVPSPKPINIVEKNIINNLLERKAIVISCGGGGIPVVKDQSNLLEGIDAVIDKDFAAELLAEVIGADQLVILTAVDNVFINFGQENEKAINNIEVKQLEEYLDEGHFAEGSMLPKIKAALKFVKSNKERKSIITSIDLAENALENKAGTIISHL